MTRGRTRPAASGAVAAPGERTLFDRPARFAGGLRPVAEGTWAWLQPNGEWGESNAGLVVGDGHALLIDTLWDPQLTERMLGAMHDVSDIPIGTLVNTHSDGDHVWGNQLVRGAQIVSTEAAARVIEEESPEALERFRAAGRGLRALGSVLRLRPARTVGEYFEGMVAPYDFTTVDLTPPDRVFGGELALDVGGREVRLVEVGPAHTPGDLIALVPDAGVIFAADILFVGVTPVMWAGPVENWVAALDLILDDDAATIVPGHGPVCGKAEVEAVRRYWVWLESATRRRLGSGMSVTAAAADIVASDEFRHAEWAAWDCPERILVNLATLERHRHGGSTQVGPGTRVRLLAQAAALAARMGAAR